MSSIYVSTDLGETFTKEWTTARTVSHIDIWAPRYLANGSIFIQMDNEIFTFDESYNLVQLGEITGNLSGDCRLTGGVQNGDVFIYAKIGDNLFYSSNEGSSWVQKVHSGTYLFGINSFNSSNKKLNTIVRASLKYPLLQ